MLQMMEIEGYGEKIGFCRINYFSNVFH